MDTVSPHDITRLLADRGRGDRDARARRTRLVHAEWRHRAGLTMGETAEALGVAPVRERRARARRRRLVSGVEAR